MNYFVFIDESGDPGKLSTDGSNSKHYSELALQVNGDGLSLLCEHITNWKYVKRICRELKTLPKGKDGIRFIESIIRLQESGIIKCSCVYVEKARYSGPYLNNDQPLKFRNFIHRRLLEHHFKVYPVNNADNIELIFDRFEMSKDEFQNLERYLRDNWNLPSIKYMTHADSSYCEPLQLTSQLVNMIKDFRSGLADREFQERLRCLPIKDA